MALNNLGMGIVFTAKDLASQVVRGLGSAFGGLDDKVGGVSERMAEKLGISVDSMTSGLKRLTIGLGVAAVGFAGFTASFSLAAKSEKFEEGLAGVSAITRATTAELVLLKDAAIDAGIATQFSPTEAVEGLQSLGAAGQNAKQATETLIPVLDLAAASLGQLGVAGSAEAVVGTLNAYGKSASEAANVTDRLVRITQISNFQARDFASGLSTAAAAGAAFNQDLNTVLVTMGLLRTMNIDASRAATSFREATSRLAADTRAQNVITKAGVDVFDKRTKKMRSLIDITRDFAAATKNLTDEQRLSQVKTAFGQRGLLAFSAIAGATAEKINELRTELENAGGAAEEFRKKMLATLGGQKKLLKGTIDTIGVVVGDDFARIMAPGVEAVVIGLNKLLQVFRELPASVRAGAALTFMFGSLALVIGGLITAGVGIATAFGSVIVAAFTAALPFILAIVGGIALLTAEIVAAKTIWDSNFGGIRDTVIEVFGAIQSVVMTVLPFLVAAFNGVREALGEVFFAILESVEPVFSEMIATSREAFGMIMAGIAPIAEALGFGDASKDALATLKSIASFFVKVLFWPITQFVKVFAFGVRFVLFQFRALFATVKFLLKVFGPIIGFMVKWNPIVFGIVRLFKLVLWVVEKIGVAFKFWGKILEPVIETIKNGLVSLINFLIRSLNSVIDVAAKIAFGMPGISREEATKNAIEIGGLKIAEIGSDGGSSSATPGISGPSSSAALSPAGSVAGGTALASGETKAQGLSTGELAALVQAVIAAQENRPIMVQGEATIDGAAVGEIRAAEEASARARSGRSRSAFGG